MPVLYQIVRNAMNQINALFVKMVLLMMINLINVLNNVIMSNFVQNVMKIIAAYLVKITWSGIIN